MIVTATTLEEAKAAAAHLLDLIGKLEAAPAAANAPDSVVTIPAAEITLKPGELYAGLVLNADGSPSHHLVLLPDQAEDVTWDAAREFAAKAGGELPTRREQALLFANAKDAFESAWYWSAEANASDGSYAWGQDFSYGDQNYDHKSYEGRARAVRRLSV